MDPCVIDIPGLLRMGLVKGWIGPRRSAQSARAYRKVWTSRGSPLKFHTEDLKNELQKELGSGWQVEMAMRYGSPSIESVVQRLSRERDNGSTEETLFVPLYPQTSFAASVSAEREIKRVTSFPHHILPPFPLDTDYLSCVMETVQEQLDQASFDHVVFSYHGIPIRQLMKKEVGACRSCKNNSECCAQLSQENSGCYRAQCFAGAEVMAKKLNLPSYSVAFQSRLGRAEWTQPSVENEWLRLRALGKKRILMVSPSFVADCLETLEELVIRGRAQWLEMGGEELKVASSLNSRPSWVRAVAKRVSSHPSKLP